MQPEYSEEPFDQPTPPPTPPDQPGATGPVPLRRPRVPVRLPDTAPTAMRVLLGLIVLVYVAGQLIPVEPNTIVKNFRVLNGEELLFIYGAKINEFILRDGEFYRLFTMMFLHGGLMHLAFNGYALYVIGTDIERLFGHARFLVVYFLGGLTASLASLILSDSMSVGASGAVFAIFAAEVVFFYQHRRLFGEIARRRLNNLVFLLFLNLAIGFSPGSMIDNWAHIGGFVGGLVLAWLIGPRFRPVPSATGDPVQDLVDDNPLSERLLVPFLWAGGLVGLLGLLLLTQG